MKLTVHPPAIGKAGQEIEAHGSAIGLLAGRVGVAPDVAGALGDLPGAATLANAVSRFAGEARHQLDAAAWLLGQTMHTLSANERQFEDTESDNKRVAAVHV